MTSENDQTKSRDVAGGGSPRPEAPTDEARSVRELRRRADFLELLAQVGRQALEAEDLEELLQRVVEFVADRLPVTIASVILLDESGTRFEKEVWTGSIDLEQPSDSGEWPISVGLAGRCARSGKPQLVLDVRSDPDYVPGNSRVEAEYMVPIRHRDEILGVLNLESVDPAIFTPEAIQAFDGIADQVAGAIRLARLNEQLERANLELRRLSSADPLTGIANRRRFDEALENEWRRALRFGSPLGLLLADVDRFKSLNDTAGHRYGDSCLRIVAEVLGSSLQRSSDLVARYGGEEFAVLLPGADLAGAGRVAEHLRLRIEERRLEHPGSPGSEHVTISIGVASREPRDEGGPEQLLRAADRALYRAKDAGRNRIVLDDLSDPSSSAELPG